MPFSLFAVAAAQSFAAGTPAYDPRRYKSAIAGKPAQVLVLGSPHLAQLPAKLDPQLLEPLLERLARFKPEVITVEGLSGEECDALRRFKNQHDGAAADYCVPMEEIEKATGLTIPAAYDEVDRTLAAWPAAPTPTQRRRLAMLFLAAGDRASATVQWLRLPEAERRSGDGLTDAMVEIIMRKGKPPNENYAIGSVLAARLGLERIYLIDDHLADGPKLPEGYSQALQRVWNPKVKPAIFVEYQRRQANVRTSSDVLNYYRWANEPATQRASIIYDMGAAAKDGSPELYGRQYLSWWENRNLRMAANIRSAFAHKPDARVLSIVGSTHKGQLDAYLDMMQDVRLVDATQFLK
jgi:hypothetical protein